MASIQMNLLRRILKVAVEDMVQEVVVVVLVALVVVEVLVALVVVEVLLLLVIHHLNILNLPVPQPPSLVLSLLPAPNLSREPAVQSQLRRVPPLMLMMEAHSRRPLKSTSLTIPLEAPVEVQEVEMELVEEEWPVTFKVHTGPG